MLEVQDTFIDFFSRYVTTNDILDAYLIPCAKIAVLYDRPILLDIILKIAATKHH